MTNILVVDDDTSVREFITCALESFGHDILSARNGYEALNLLALGGTDLVFTDVNMPDMNGIELSHRIRADHPELPIIAHTTYIPDESEHLFDAVLYKPCRLAEMNRAVERVMEQPVTV